MLVDGIMWNNSVKLFFKFESVVQEEMPFKDISYLELWWPLCLAERNHLCIYVSGRHEERFSENDLNRDQKFRRRCRLKISLI